MKRCVFALLLAAFLAALLVLPARGSDLAGEVEAAAPEAAQGLSGDDFSGGLSAIWEQVREGFGGLLRQGLSGAVQLLVVLVLCGVGETVFVTVEGKRTFNYLSLAAVAAVVAVSAGEMDQLIGMGVETIASLEQFSKSLLPALAAATAATGMAGSAAVRQMATVLFCDVLLTVIHRLLLPFLYVYIGALAAGAMLGDGRLEAIASLLKKAIAWCLGALLTLFTLYLSVAGAVSGAADAAAVKLAQKAITTAVPVVGSIVAGAAETVLAGAGLLKNTIGIFGVLAILATCALPFVRLGIQYLLYKAVAFVAGTVAPPGLVKLIGGLGSAFGLVLGMVGGCAMLLTISVLSSLLAIQG